MAQVKKLVLLLLSPVFVRCRSNWFSIFDGFRDCSAYIPLFVCGSCRVSWLGSDSCSFCRDLLWVWIVGKSWMFGELGFVFEFVNWVFFPFFWSIDGALDFDSGKFGKNWVLGPFVVTFGLIYLFLLEKQWRVGEENLGNAIMEIRRCWAELIISCYLSPSCWVCCKWKCQNLLCNVVLVVMISLLIWCNMSILEMFELEV